MSPVRSEKAMKRHRAFVGDNSRKQLLRLKVNGEIKEVASETNKTLLEVLREDMGLTGTKHGCELGECGTCTVFLIGLPEARIVEGSVEGHLGDARPG